MASSWAFISSRVRRSCSSWPVSWVLVDVSSASHPFYTGTQRILDTAGRVEKFGNKYGKGGLSNLIKKK
jgi:ribosomal protein L31